jgi:hypothetical protein
VDDYDFQVYRPDGTQVGESASLGGLETMTQHVDAPGVYTVVVTSFSQNVTGYDAEASLAAPAPPPPPVATDGTVSPGSPYTWEGSLPVPSNAAFNCSPNAPVKDHGVGTVFCDNRTVQVDVPAGGGTLSVAAAPKTDGDIFTIYVYDASGTEVATGDDAVTVTVPRSGIYRIGVTSLIATDGYRGTASVA